MLPSSSNLTVLTLSTRDLTRSRRFYQTLGFKHKFTNAEVVFFQMQGSVLALYRSDLLSRDLKLRKKPIPGGINPAINLGSKKAVDALYKKAIRAGAKPIRPPHEAEWGGYTSYFSDPDGHPWEVAWNPFWKLDKRGNITI
jgi:predicted lactoylglutathione lyase